jgi:hypothetical protein
MVNMPNELGDWTTSVEVEIWSKPKYDLASDEGDNFLEQHPHDNNNILHCRDEDTWKLRQDPRASDQRIPEPYVSFIWRVQMNKI